MSLDKNNLDLELLAELAMKIVVAKYGIDCYLPDIHTGEERLTSDARPTTLQRSKTSPIC